MHANPFSGMVEKIDLDIVVPDDFPEKYSEALVRTAELCAVKKHFENPPSFRVTTKSAQPVVS
jgi:ribosomal protein S12 methylthiotransferase accessory factor